MKLFHLFCLSLCLLCCFFSCSNSEEHVAEAVNEKDSLPFMHAIGVSTLISDSGVIRYHLVAEEWDIFNHPERPSSWRFCKGMLMERFDTAFHIDMYVQADTAYLHNQRLWELRGRVRIRNVENTRFFTEELFWDMDRHEMWNHQFMRIVTPDRTLHGTNFRSNETMTRYAVTNSVGDFPAGDIESDSTGTDLQSDTPSSRRL